MRSAKNGTRVEALLRAAADFTPAADAPNALALRALERAGLLPGSPAEPRRITRRNRAFTRPLALSSALAGTLAVAIRFLGSADAPFAPPRSAPAVFAQREAAPPIVAGAGHPQGETSIPLQTGARAAQAHEAHSVAPAARPPERVVQAAARHRRRLFGSAPRPFSASWSGDSRPARPRRFLVATPPTPPTPPRAHWHVRTVEQENYGVLAPAWMTFHAPAGNADSANEGEIVGAVPVVVDLPLDSPDVAYAADIVPIDYNPHHP